MQNLVPLDPKRLSYPVTDEVNLAVGKIITSFSALEASAEMLIWAFLNLPPKHGAVLTKMDARPKFELLRKLMEERPGDLPDNKAPETEFWKALSDAREKRNSIAHNQWAMLDASEPVLVRMERNKVTGHQYGEVFTIDILAALVARMDAIRSVFHMTLGHIGAPLLGIQARPIVA